MQGSLLAPLRLTHRRPESGDVTSLNAFCLDYDEHLVRDGDELNKIRDYIRTNPLRWSVDPENPQAS